MEFRLHSRNFTFGEAMQNICDSNDDCYCNFCEVGLEDYSKNSHNLILNILTEIPSPTDKLQRRTVNISVNCEWYYEKSNTTNDRVDFYIQKLSEKSTNTSYEILKASDSLETILEKIGFNEEKFKRFEIYVNKICADFIVSLNNIVPIINVKNKE